MNASVHLRWRRELHCDARFDDLFHTPATFQVEELPRASHPLFVAEYLAWTALTALANKRPPNGRYIVCQRDLESEKLIVQQDVMKSARGISLKNVCSQFCIENADGAHFDNRMRYWAQEILRLSKAWSERPAMRSNTIGVHIRGTDNRDASETSTEDRFVDAIKSHSEKDRSTKFFLATDDEEVRERLSSLFSGSISSNEFAEKRNRNREGLRWAMNDLVGLAQTKLIFGSHFSSFGEFAALAGNVPLLVVGKDQFWRGPYSDIQAVRKEPARKYRLHLRTLLSTP